MPTSPANSSVADERPGGAIHFPPSTRIFARCTPRDVATSTIHRWLNDGIIAGEQLTPGAPWRIRLTDDLRSRVAEDAPEEYLTMYQAMRQLGISRQAVWQRVKRGEIEAIHVRRGRKKGLRLKLIRSQRDLFNQTS